MTNIGRLMVSQMTGQHNEEDVAKANAFAREDFGLISNPMRIWRNRNCKTQL